ncbi:MAG: hypothetical protein PHW63_06705 [Alphaproteobacteria bacterium]|nr:hypothetical protein [Alphaproteobacteria bacterium]
MEPDIPPFVNNDGKERGWKSIKKSLCYTNGPMKGITSRAVFVIASDRRERGNPVLLPETWGLDRHVAALLAMT